MKFSIKDKSPPGSVTAAIFEDSFQMTQEFCCKGVTGMIAAFNVAMVSKN
jgi:hypothetical protein